MNATIFDFLDKWGDYDFRRLHIQPTDFLIFAILSYATFENTSYYKENKDKNKFFDIKNFYKEGFDNLNKTNFQRSFTFLNSLRVNDLACLL